MDRAHQWLEVRLTLIPGLLFGGLDVHSVEASTTSVTSVEDSTASRSLDDPPCRDVNCPDEQCTL